MSSVVGLNDYRVKEKGKEKVHHINPLKKYYERDEATTEGAVAVVKADDHFKEDMHCEIEECEVKDAEDGDNVDFLEIGGYDAKESVADVAISFQVYLPRHQVLQTSPSSTSNLPQMSLFGQDHIQFPTA